MADESPLASREYQTQVINYMLHDSDFRSVAVESLTPEMFSSKDLQWFFETIGNAPIPLTKTTLKEELVRAANKKRIRKEEVSAYVELYKDLSHAPLPDDQEHIRHNISSFVRLQNVKKAIIESFDLAKEQKWEEVESIISKAVSSGVDVMSLGHNYFQEYEARIQDRVTHEESRSVDTGIPELTEALSGGIQYKQVGLIVGGTGRGKSLFLQWLARAAILMGEQVVYYTFELPAKSIAARLDSMYLQIKPRELRERHQESLEKMSQFAKKFGSSLIIKEYSWHEVSVRGIEQHYKLLCSTLDIRPRVILIDYADLVKPMYRRTENELKEAEETIQAMCSFAKRYDLAVWTAAQLNRAGMGSENLSEMHIAGYVGVLFGVDIAIFLAQTNEEAELEELRLQIVKSRNGKKGISITIDTHFQFMSFFRHKVAEEQPNEDNSQPL